MSYRDNGEAIIQMNDALQQDKENLLREVEELTEENDRLKEQNKGLWTLAALPPSEIHHYGLPPRRYVIASVMAVIGIISLMIGWVGLLTVP